MVREWFLFVNWQISRWGSAVFVEWSDESSLVQNGFAKSGLGNFVQGYDPEEFWERCLIVGV